MKILFLQVNYDSHIVCPPFNVGYLASALERQGHIVGLFDGTLHNAGEEDYLAAVESFRPDLIGISVFSRGHGKAKRLIAALKRRCDVQTVIGGPQVTAMPEAVIEDIGADFGVIGEGEETICELASALVAAKGVFSGIDGLAYRQGNGRVVLNKPRGLIENLDSIPYPAWHLMPPSDYWIVPILATAKSFPIAPIMTSRGCPFPCTFCASNITWKFRVRYRSPENVIGEMRLLRDKYGVREFLITDDNFTLNKNFAMSVCEGIIKEDLRVNWQCSNGVRVDSLSPELLRLMKKAGCYSVGLGIESGNQEILDRAKKKLDLRKVRKTLGDLNEAGIKSYGFFIFGFPGETRSSVADTMEFALSNRLDRAWFNIMTPYPGSELFNDWIKKRSFKDIDWDRHDGSTADLDWCELTGKELDDCQRTAARRFYLRPRIIFDILLHMSGRQILTIFMTRFFRKYNKGIFELIHSRIRKKTTAPATAPQEARR
ncbi:MAG: B12-binding domain-containing radical SAM protein [Deltaproteobacteria bacterium]|nr:B12-binding domain-containing radical SAM protein [Deltaproteobacteria bacterium]